MLANPAFDDETGAGAGSASDSATAAGSAGTTGDGTGAGTGGATGEATGAGGGSESSTGGCLSCVCAPGATEACYGGEAGTEGVGVCKAGTRTCEPSGAAWGVCEGEILPSMDVCGDGLDQDCSGAPDDDASCLVDPECPQIAGLVACYPFPDGVIDQLRDGSGKQHHGSMSGVSLIEGPPGHGKAGKFGLQSVAAIPDHVDFNSSAFTVALLLAPGNNVGEVGLVDKENQYGLFYSGGAAGCIVVNDAAQIKTAVVMVPGGMWSFLACVYDGMNVTVQRYDGASQTNQIGLGGALNPNSQGGIQVGNDTPQLGKAFQGGIDGLLFFDRALGAQELCSLAGPLCQ